ncbi:FCPF, partial [Symbiodinium necroappetens]
MGRRVRGSTALVAGAGLCLVPGVLFVPSLSSPSSVPRAAPVSIPSVRAPGQGESGLMSFVGAATTAALAVCVGRVTRAAEPVEAAATPAEKDADAEAAASTTSTATEESEVPAESADE